MILKKKIKEATLKFSVRSKQLSPLSVKGLRGNAFGKILFLRIPMLLERSDWLKPFWKPAAVRIKPFQ
jgi:hypothetical protein